MLGAVPVIAITNTYQGGSGDNDLASELILREAYLLNTAGLVDIDSVGSIWLLEDTVVDARDIVISTAGSFFQGYQEGVYSTAGNPIASTSDTGGELLRWINDNLALGGGVVATPEELKENLTLAINHLNNLLKSFGYSENDGDSLSFSLTIDESGYPVFTLVNTIADGASVILEDDLAYILRDGSLLRTLEVGLDITLADGTIFTISKDSLIRELSAGYTTPLADDSTLNFDGTRLTQTIEGNIVPLSDDDFPIILSNGDALFFENNVLILSRSLGNTTVTPNNGSTLVFDGDSFTMSKTIDGSITLHDGSIITRDDNGSFTHTLSGNSAFDYVEAKIENELSISTLRLVALFDNFNVESYGFFVSLATSVKQQIDDARTDEGIDEINLNTALNSAIKELNNLSWVLATNPVIAQDRARLMKILVDMQHEIQRGINVNGKDITMAATLEYLDHIDECHWIEQKNFTGACPS